MPHVPSIAGRSLFEWITLACRLVLGGVLVYAGAIKLPDLESSVLSVRLYDLPGLFGNPDLFWWTRPVGYAQPILEVVVGVMLIAGLFTRWSAVLGALAMAVFIFGIASVWARGISIDCGCFGSGKEISAEEALRTYPWDIARDIGLLACGAWAAWKPRSPFAVDNWLLAPVTVDELDETDELDATDATDEGDPK